jgi:hypothetical protein
MPDEGSDNRLLSEAEVAEIHDRAAAIVARHLKSTRERRLRTRRAREKDILDIAARVAEDAAGRAKRDTGHRIEPLPAKPGEPPWIQARALHDVGASPAEIAQSVGVSEGLVGAWLHG